MGEVRRAVRRRHPTRSTPGSCGPAGFDAAAALPGAAERARRPVHAVRRDVLRRGADAGGGRVRRRDVQPARRSSGRHTAWGQAINGAKHPTVPGTGWGSVDVDDVMAVLDHALRATRSATRTASACSAGATAATWRRCSPAASATASGRSAASGRQQHGHRGVSAATSARRSARRMGPNRRRGPRRVCRACRRSAYGRDITVPMLIIHSENDLRCPINQAEELFVALRRWAGT